MRTFAAVGFLLVFTALLTIVATRDPAHATNGVPTCPSLISRGSPTADAHPCPRLRGMQNCPGEALDCPYLDAHRMTQGGGTSCPYVRQTPVLDRDRSTMDKTQAGDAATEVKPVQATRIAWSSGIHSL